jgi:hypothetical protein
VSEVLRYESALDHSFADAPVFHVTYVLLVVVGAGSVLVREHHSFRDRDRKYSGSFDEVVRSEAIRTVKTPERAPKANAIAERFVRTVRSECLDWLLILNRCHLERVLRVYVDHYNTQRPHRALELCPPTPEEAARSTGSEIQRRDRLGGLIHEYTARPHEQRHE